ncbi:MAG: hypothetical protein JOZ59_01520 [Candidatus Eremiobacteraeota bacterium]|nr:hypothetical protein [Candidatus Eremiobacteraeota bacterium]
MGTRKISAIFSAAGMLFAFAASRASAAPGMHAGSAMHAMPPLHPATVSHGAVLHVPSLPPTHGSMQQDADDRPPSHQSSNARSITQPQTDTAPVHRPYLPWWFRRRHIAAPQLPIF